MLERAICFVILALAAASPGASFAAISIHVLSNRADLVSGGDALVAIDLPGDVAANDVVVTLGDADVTDQFAIRENGRFAGLVSGLAIGPNVLRATLPDTSGAEITITNHPNGGPVFSGPQIQPWICQAGAVDAQCNQPATYRYQYKSSAGGAWTDYDPANPPSDVATTTTDQGNEVPLIIRIETGYQDRDQYAIASLWDPSDPSAPWDPQKGFNGKVLINHGASCGIDHQSGSAPAVTGGNADEALSRGFAVMSTALDNAGHNCNIVTQAESLAMAKERLVETLGEVRYTIGTGCSGGSLTQQQVANAYPGVYQGILPQCSFPDAWSTGQQLVDYHLIRRYVEDPTRWTPGVVWTPLEIAAVEGHPNHVNSIVLDELYLTSLGDPTNACAGVSAAERYHPETNPDGVRCTLADYMINVFGEPENPQNPDHLGRDFAGRPLDNVGVQYGLDALERGFITVDQYVDLNAKIGGADLDINYTEARTAADQPALRNAYRSGGINVGNNLDQVAIIDLRGPDHGAFHDAYRTWAVRARLVREHGHHDNHVIWFGHVPLIGDPGYTTEGLIAMDEWLAAVEADTSADPLAVKIVKNRPADLQDRCSQIEGVETIVLPVVGQVCTMKDVQSRYATPRMVAGEGVETDVNKCSLKPHVREEYYPITFSDDQWGRLDAAFPGGVCDWSVPGPDQQDTIPWQTYQDAGGNVISGGTPLGPPPQSVPIDG